MRITNSQNENSHTKIQGLQTVHQLSPLQRLQAEYQHKLELEKQKKMSALQQRWKAEAKKSSTIVSFKRNEDNTNAGYNSSAGSMQSRYLSHSNHRRQQRYTGSAQVNPRPRQLPPLSNGSKSNSFHEGQPKGRSRVIDHPREVNHTSQNDLSDDRTISPPPNLNQLRLLRERKILEGKFKKESQHHQENIENLFHDGKMTDFQKWQQERDAEKIARLKKHKQHDQTQHIPSKANNTRRNEHNNNERGLISHEVHQKISSQSRPDAVKTDKSLSQNVGRHPNHTSNKMETISETASAQEMDKLLEKLKKKKMELERMERARTDDSRYSGSENEWEAANTRNTQKMMLKPVKIKPHRTSASKSKQMKQTDKVVFKHSDNDIDGDSDIGFQVRPVLVRRDGSGRSSKASTTQEKVNYNQAFGFDKSTSHKTSNANHGTNSQQLLKQQIIENTGYNVPDTETPTNLLLRPCKICGRKFADDRLAKHTKICSKASTKKRKVFNMTQARVQGTDMEKYNRGKRATKDPIPKKSNWRAKHEDFIQTIRNAKILQDHVAKGGKLSDLPPPPPSENPDYIKCDYCGRKFAAHAAERHIPWCKSKSRNKPFKRR